MRRLVLLIVAACRHGDVDTPPLANHAPRTDAGEGVFIIEDGVGVLTRDPTTGELVPIPGTEGFGATSALPAGAYLVDQDLAVDLRAPARGIIRDDDEIDSGAVIASGDGPLGEIDAINATGGIELRIAGTTHTLTIGEDAGTFDVAVAPDGRTVVAVLGNGGTEVDADLYAIDLAAPHLVRLTFSHDVSDFVFVDDSTVLLGRYQDELELSRLSLSTGQSKPVRLPDGADAVAGDWQSTAPLIPLTGASNGLFDPRDGSILPLADGERVLAVARDGRTVAVTSSCSIPGDLRRATRDGETTLRKARGHASCVTHDTDVLVSAAFDRDGRMFYAIPGGPGWQVLDDGRIVVESPRPLAVVAWP